MPRLRRPRFGYNLSQDGEVHMGCPGNCATREETQEHLDRMLEICQARDVTYSGQVTESEWVETDEDCALRIVGELAKCLDAIDVPQSLIEEAREMKEEIPWMF